MPDRLITLAIDETPTAAGAVFTFRVRFDDRLVVADGTLTLTQSEQVRDIGETYGAVFANPQDPASFRLAPAQLRAIGLALFDIWFKSSWSQLAVQPGDRQILVIASGIPEILNLPWELMRPPEREEIGTDAGWGIRRLPWPDRQLATAASLNPGPLRVLFVASSPRDPPELDYELEEELLQRALGPKAQMESAILGMFDELVSLTDDFGPHILHLSGHGTVGERRLTSRA